MFWSVSGSAPVAISGARNSASDWVCPLITAEPPVMPWLQLMLESAATGGWLITTESRVIAISRLGSPTGLQAAAPVSFSKAVLPLPEKVSWVSHWPVETPLVAVWICAWAPVMSVPPSATGPICSLVALAVGRCWPDSVAQSTVCWFGLSLASQVSGLPQSTLSKGACLYLGSLVVSICCLVGAPPLGLCGLKVTLVPPRRSSPSLGLMLKAAIESHTPATTTKTATSGTTSRRFPGTALRSFVLGSPALPQSSE